MQPLVGPSISRGNKELLRLSPWKYNHENVLFLLHKLNFRNSYSVILFFYTKLCLLSDSQTQRFPGCYMGEGPGNCIVWGWLTEGGGGWLSLTGFVLQLWASLLAQTGYYRS